MRAEGFESRWSARWAGGWALTRVAFGLAAIDAQLARWPDVRAALAVPELVFASGPTRISDHVLLGPVAAWILWGVAFLPLVGVILGRSWARAGVLSWFVLHASLLAALGLNVRAPERFVFLLVVALLFSPIDEPALHRKWRSPAPRWLLILLYSSLYGSTGWLKLIVDPAWWTGDALRYDLVERFHAGGVLATWLSGHPALCLAMSWFTLGFEALFPILVWWPAATPWLLLVGVGMHLGIGALMHVGPLGTMAMSAYPALCDPDRAEALWKRAVGVLDRVRGLRGGTLG